MLFADVDPALTGGGIVGGIMSTLLTAYVMYDKIVGAREKRRARQALSLAAVRAKDVVTEAAELKNNEEEIRIGELARKAVEDAYKDALAVRKSNHDADIRAVKREIAATNLRIESLEAEKLECRREVSDLKVCNAEKTREIAALRAHVVELEAKLRAAGSLPGSGPHTPLE